MVLFCFYPILLFTMGALTDILSFSCLLPLNFNSPYRAVTITEFWDRWHMTLTRFLQNIFIFPLEAAERGRPELA